PGILATEGAPADEDLQELVFPRERISTLPDRPDRRSPPDRPLARRERDVAQQHAEQRRLPAAVPPRHREALAGREIEVDWAEPEPAQIGHRAMQGGDEAPRTFSRVERQLQLPRLERLAGKLVPLEQPFGLPDLRPECPRAAPVRLCAAGTCLAAPACEQLA